MIFALWGHREEFSLCYSFGSTPDMDPVPGNDSSPANFLYPEHFRVSQGVSVKLDSSCIDASFATAVQAPCKQRGARFFTYQPRSSPPLRKLQSLFFSHFQAPTSLYPAVPTTSAQCYCLKLSDKSPLPSLPPERASPADGLAVVLSLL